MSVAIINHIGFLMREESFTSDYFNWQEKKFKLLLRMIKLSHGNQKSIFIVFSQTHYT